MAATKSRGGSARQRRGEPKSAKKRKPAMAKHTDAHPGIEIDGKGHPIPVDKRLPDDRAATHRASRRKAKKT